MRDEIVELRRENSKTFDLGKGKHQAVISIGAIHYKDNYADPGEQWRDIDLTWVGNKITKAPYELTLDGKKITIKDKRSGEISSIELLDSQPAGLPFEIILEYTRVSFRHTIPSDKVPFEAKFKIVGKVSYLTTNAFDDDGELELDTSLVAGILTEKITSVKDKETGAVRPAKSNIRIDPTWKVGASTDDCFRRLSSDYFSLIEPTFQVGATTAVNRDGSGARFTNITIPQGATIDNGTHLTLRCRTSRTGTVVRSRISAEDVDDAVTFSTSANFDTRYAARTTARVDWDGIGAQTAGVDYDSPEIKTVIQEITDRGGWASGQDIVIFWEDFDDRSTHATDCLRQAQSYNGSTTFAPKLVVIYTTGWAGGDVNGVAIAGVAKINGVALADITKVNGVA